jgi:uncharacterized small protein (DUF1192 family)
MLDKIKNLFIVDEGAKEGTPATKKTEGTKPASTPKPQAKTSTPVSNEVPRPSANSQPSERFVNKLLEAIEKNNIEGFDYLEFKQSLQSLGNVDMDDSTRYKSALAMAKTMGATPTSLVQSGDKYLAVLLSEEQKFQVAFDNQQTNRVQKREEKLQAHVKGIKDREDRIVELQQEVEKLKADLEQIKQTSSAASAKVAATKDGFYGAYHILVDQIKKDLDMIKQHGS